MQPSSVGDRRFRKNRRAPERTGPKSMLNPCLTGFSFADVHERIPLPTRGCLWSLAFSREGRSPFCLSLDAAHLVS